MKWFSEEGELKQKGQEEAVGVTWEGLGGPGGESQVGTPGHLGDKMRAL